MRLFALLAALVVCHAYWVQRETPTEKRLSAVAGAIAGHEVDVYCPSVWKRILDISSAGGSAHYDADGVGRKAYLTHEHCKTLARIGERGFGGSFECLRNHFDPCDEEIYAAAAAVHVLSHESWHLAGIRDEALAECYAVQTDAVIADRLGATPGQASAIATWAFRSNNQVGTSAYRFSSDCSAGGRHDLDPYTAAWPG
jgi:hypothetical protein